MKDETGAIKGQKDLLKASDGVVILLCITFLCIFPNQEFHPQALLVIILITCFMYAIFSSFKTIHHLVLFAVFIVEHILLFLNAEGWNEGSMHGSYYYIQELQTATDALYGMLLLSAFTFFIPMILYMWFLKSLSKLMYCMTNKEKSKPQEESSENLS